MATVKCANEETLTQSLPMTSNGPNSEVWFDREIIG